MKDMLHMYEFILNLFISRDSILPSWDFAAEPGGVVSYNLVGLVVFPGLPFC